MGNTKILVTEDNVHVGMRVCRGRDWTWDNQDEGKPGTIVKKHNEGWWNVKWDWNEKDLDEYPVYRVGYNQNTKDGKIKRYDLYVYIDEKVQEGLIQIPRRLQEDDTLKCINTANYYGFENNLTLNMVYPIKNIHIREDLPYCRIEFKGVPGYYHPSSFILTPETIKSLNMREKETYFKKGIK